MSLDKYLESETETNKQLLEWAKIKGLNVNTLKTRQAKKQESLGYYNNKLQELVKAFFKFYTGQDENEDLELFDGLNKDWKAIATKANMVQKVINVDYKAFTNAVAYVKGKRKERELLSKQANELGKTMV